MYRIFHKVLLITSIFFFPVLMYAEGLSIDLDYRFDGGYFSEHPERRIPLEYAASLWQKVLTTSVQIDAGTSIRLRGNYEEPGETVVTIAQSIGAFKIFVYAHDFSLEVKADGDADPSTSKAFGGNFGKGNNFGYLAFNTNTDNIWFFDQSPETEYDVPVRGRYDLITSAVHEMGHVLGFLRSFQEPFVQLYGDADERFIGTAVQKYNNGNAVPLKWDSSHIRGDWWNDEYLPTPPIDRHVMHTGDPVQGYRQVMTAIDLAIMEDIGWDVDYSALPLYPYTPRNSDPRKKQLGEVFGINFGRTNPVGLWVMDTEAYVDDAVIGNPLRYSPPFNETGGLPDLYDEGENAIEVPLDGFLYCVPRLEANGGGTDCNIYSIVMDIKISEYGRYYTLFNTNPDNANDGDSFINSSGYLGAGSNGYSTSKIPLNEWTRIAVVIDASSGKRTYFINGDYSHDVDDVQIDGRFAIYPSGEKDGFFCLFGDNDGEDNPLLVKRIAIYDSALTKKQVEALGNTASTNFGL